MKWEEIVQKYPDEWVLLDVKEVDEDLNIKDAEVIAYAADQNEIYKNLLDLRPAQFAIEYTGKIPEDLAVVLYLCETL